MTNDDLKRLAEGMNLILICGERVSTEAPCAFNAGCDEWYVRFDKPLPTVVANLLNDVKGWVYAPYDQLAYFTPTVNVPNPLYAPS